MDRVHFADTTFSANYFADRYSLSTKIFPHLGLLNLVVSWGWGWGVLWGESVMIVLLSIKFANLMLALNTNCCGSWSTFRFVLFFEFAKSVIQIMATSVFDIQKSVHVYFWLAFCRFNHFSTIAWSARIVLTWSHD